MRRLLAAAAICTLTAAATARAATPQDAAEPYGLLSATGNLLPGNTLAERTANYRKLYDAGVRAIRLDLSWTAVEPPGPPLHDYDFSGVDREVQAITGAGLKVIGLLDYGHPDYSAAGGTVARTPLAGGLPPFSVGNDSYYPPDDPADFGAFARAVAAHFAPAGDVVGWEIWNEENEGWRFWAPHEDPAAYARLLCAAEDAIKLVDARTPVAFGGVFYPAIADLPGMSGPDFVKAAYRSDPALGRCFDAMAYHPYPYPFTAPELDDPIRGSVLAAADGMRAAMPRTDRSKPLWITEIGWPTHDRTYGVPEQKQAQYIARTALASFAQGIPVVNFYTYGDYDDPTGANQEAWFGFFRADGTPKPSYTALRTFSDTFRGAAFDRDLSRALHLPRGGLMTGGRGFALRYRRGTTWITAVWLANESAAEGQGHMPPGGTLPPATIGVRVPVRSGAATVVDYLGGLQTVDARHGAIRLTAGPGPQYVIDAAPPPTTRATAGR
ncbi:MAG: hypothetical protein ACJ76Z_00370 [Thermoleophilaceae bacterium]